MNPGTALGTLPTHFLSSQPLSNAAGSLGGSQSEDDINHRAEGRTGNWASQERSRDPLLFREYTADTVTARTTGPARATEYGKQFGHSRVGDFTSEYGIARTPEIVTR